MRENPEKDIVRVRSVVIGHGRHVQSVRMQVRNVGCMLTVDVTLKAPSCANFGMDYLKDLLGKKEGEAGPRILWVSASDLCLRQRAHFTPKSGCHINRVRTRPNLSLLLVQTQHVSDLDANGPIISNSNGGSGTDSIIAEKRRRGIARRR